MITLLGAGCGASPLTSPACFIVSPAAGVAITAAADTNPSLADIQVDVSVRTTGLGGGGQVELLVTQAPFATAVVGRDGEITFPGVTLPAGPATAKLACRVVGAVTASEIAVSVGPSCALRFLQPAPSQTVTSADLRPGPDGRPSLEVLVEVQGVQARAPVDLEVGEAGSPQATARTEVVGREARFLVPLNQGSSVRFSARAGGLLCAPSAETRVHVELGQCATALVPPLGAGLGLAEHLGGGVPPATGLSTRVCLRTECVDGSNAFLRVDDLGEQNAAVSNGRACFSVDLTEGPHTLGARVEGPGQEGVAPAVTWCVDLVAPNVVVTSPQPGITLHRADDQAPNTRDGIEIPVEGSITGLANPSCPAIGSASQVEILVDSAVQQRLRPESDGRFQGAANLPQGNSTIEVCVTDEVGNRACADPRLVSVDLGLPILRISSPAPGARVLRAADLDPQTHGELELDVEVGATGLMAGDPVTLEVDWGRWVCAGRVEQQGGSLVARIRVGPPACAGLPDGEHRLVARALDGAGRPTRSQEVAILVDGSPPTLRFDQPRDGAVLARAVSDVVLATDAEDGQLVSLQVGTAASLVAEAAGGGVVFSGVLLLPGPNPLAARVADRAGNETSASVLVVHDAIEPSPSFSSPADGQILSAADDQDGDPANGFDLAVRVAVPPELDGTVVDVWVDATPQATCPLVAGVATCMVQLAEGPHELRALVRDPAGNWESTAISVSVETGLPRVRVSVPIAGTHLRGLDDLDPTETGLQTLVNLASSRPIASCLATVGELKFPLSPDGPSCEGWVTLAEGHQVLVVTAEDDTGRVGRSVPVPVTVDTRPPTLSFREPESPTEPLAQVVLNRASIDFDGRPGFQTRVVIEADDIEAGQAATLAVLANDGALPATYAALFDVSRRAVFPSVTLADGRRTTLVAVASDRAGNRSPPVAVSVVVDRVAPVLQIVTPTAGQVLGDGDDESSAAGLQKTVVVRVSGAEAGQAVRLLVRGPNAGLVSADVWALLPETGEVKFPGVTLGPAPGGPFVLSATVADRHGNVATDVVTVAQREPWR